MDSGEVVKVCTELNANQTDDLSPTGENQSNNVGNQSHDQLLNVTANQLSGLETNSSLQVNNEKAEIHACRICQIGGEYDNLFHSCKCKGSIGFYHEHCLLKWVAHRGLIMCELCNSKYNVQHKGLKPIRRWRRVKIQIQDVIQVAGFCILTASLMISILWILWLSFSSSEEAKEQRDSAYSQLTYYIYLPLNMFFLSVMIAQCHFIFVPIGKKWWNTNSKLQLVNVPVTVTETFSGTNSRYKATEEVLPAENHTRANRLTSNTPESDSKEVLAEAISTSNHVTQKLDHLDAAAIDNKQLDELVCKPENGAAQKPCSTSITATPATDKKEPAAITTCEAMRQCCPTMEREKESRDELVSTENHEAVQQLTVTVEGDKTMEESISKCDCGAVQQYQRTTMRRKIPEESMSLLSSVIVRINN